MSSRSHLGCCRRLATRLALPRRLRDRLRRRCPRLRRDLLPPNPYQRHVCIGRAKTRTHKVTVQEEEVDKVADHRRLLDATLLCAGNDKVAAEPSRLFHLRKLRVDDGGTVRMREGLRAAAAPRPLMVLLPLVDLVTSLSALFR